MHEFKSANHLILQLMIQMNDLLELIKLSKCYIKNMQEKKTLQIYFWMREKKKERVTFMINQFTRMNQTFQMLHKEYTNKTCSTNPHLRERERERVEFKMNQFARMNPTLIPMLHTR